MTARVSVVIACLDAEATLAVQLQALAQQKCSFTWDLIISDNGSRDRTVAIARGFAAQLPRLRIVDSSDRPGAGHARNVGAAASDAPLLVFCDADDQAAPGWLAAIVAALEQDPFVAGSFEARKLNRPRVLRSRSLQQNEGLQRSPFGPKLPHAGPGNLGIERALFLGAGGFDPQIGCLEDTDLCWRLQLSGTRLAFAPEAVMHVRLRSSLRGMFAQARAYGDAAALLENRYRGQDRRDTAGTTTGPPRRRLNTPASLLRFVRRHRSLGAALWTVGWHLGYRRHQAQNRAQVTTSSGPSWLSVPAVLSGPELPGPP